MLPHVLLVNNIKPTYAYLPTRQLLGRLGGPMAIIPFTCFAYTLLTIRKLLLFIPCHFSSSPKCTSPSSIQFGGAKKPTSLVLVLVLLVIQIPMLNPGLLATQKP